VIIKSKEQRKSPNEAGGVFFLSRIWLNQKEGAVSAVLAKGKWQSVHFGIHWSSLTPYCHCGETLSMPKYALVIAMPTIVLGFLPYLIGLVFGLLPVVHFGLLFIIAGGGDAYILWRIRKERHGLILDHPYLLGCVVFYPKLQGG